MRFERERAWIAETHGAYFELTRHFFLRLFDTDMVTTPGQLQAVIIGILAAICSATMYLPISMFRKYVDLTYGGFYVAYHQHAMADRLMFVLIPMVLTGFLGALLWNSLFPSDKDYLVLMPLPISRLQMFAAKLTSVTLFVCLFVAAVSLFPSTILPMVQDSKFALMPLGLRQIMGQVVAALSGSLFIFLALVGIQGLLMNLLGKWLFPRVSLLFQSALVLFLLTLMPQVFTIAAFYRTGRVSSAVELLAPPFWFHAISEVASGRPEPKFQELALRGLLALIIALVSTLASYAISYYRQASSNSESDQHSTLGWLESVCRLGLRLLRRPIEEAAIVSFILKTLARSRQHKLLLSAYFGVGLAILINSYLGLAFDGRVYRRVEARQEDVLLTAISAPLVLSFFFLSGVRVVFSLPVAIQANWIFRMLEDDRRGRWLDGVETALYVLALTPVVVIAPVFLVPVLGWGSVPIHLMVCVLLTLILVEIILWEWQKVPFVCSYLPGKQNIALTFVAYWMAFGVYAYTTATFELWCLREPVRLLMLVGLLLAAFAKIRMGRKDPWGKLALKFEDEIEPVVATLGLTRNS